MLVSSISTSVEGEPVLSIVFMAPHDAREAPPNRRLPYMKWMPNRVRNHFIAICGEFAGTFLFLFFALSATQVANTSEGEPSTANLAQLLYISLAFGFSLMVNVWVFFRISGGLFNPAVRPCPTLCSFSRLTGSPGRTATDWPCR